MSIRKDGKGMAATETKPPDLRVRLEPDTFWDLKKLAGELKMAEKEAMAYAIRLALGRRREGA